MNPPHDKRRTSLYDPSERDLINTWLWEIARCASRWRAASIAFAIEEAHVICIHLCGLTFLTFPLILPNLKPSIDGDQPTLGEMIGHSFPQFAPTDYVNEISLSFALLVRERPVYGDSHIRNRYTAVGITQLWVRNQSPNEHYSVQHAESHSPWNTCARGLVFLQPNQQVPDYCISDLHDALKLASHCWLRVEPHHHIVALG
jgi:hypothetical protein